MIEEETHRDFYIDEQLGHAVSDLATGTERIKGRLETAAVYRLVWLSPEMLPEPLRVLATTIFERLHSAEAAGDEGTCAASIRAMSEEDACSLASDILSLHYRHDEYWRERGEV